MYDCVDYCCYVEIGGYYFVDFIVYCFWCNCYFVDVMFCVCVGISGEFVSYYCFCGCLFVFLF